MSERPTLERLTFGLEMVQLPPTPNARLHWAARARLTKDWREAAETAALNAIRKFPGPKPGPMPACRMTVTVTMPDRRSRDEDNVRACLKPLTDGAVSAGVIVDDGPAGIRSTEVIIVQSPGRRGFRIEYQFERVDP